VLQSIHQQNKGKKMRYTVLTEYDALEAYRELIDQTEPMVEVCGSTFMPSRVLEDMDPVCFREGFLDYVNAIAESGTLVEGHTDDLLEDEDEDLGETDDFMAMRSAGYDDESYGVSLHDE
jgi:hypothetical protein